MRGPMTVMSAVFALATPAMAHAASVELKDVYARIQVIPEDRADVAVDVRSPDGRLPAPRVVKRGDEVLVDGGLRPWNQCSGVDLGGSVYIPGHGYVPHGSALIITIHAPRQVRLSVSGAVTGEVKSAQDLDLQTDGCSRWTIADVSDALVIRQGGASSIHAGSAGKTTLELSGVTHIDLARANGLDVDMSGMGNVRLGSITGPVEAKLSGMGAVKIDAGRAERVRAAVSGVGGFTLHGSAKALDAEVSGIGGVHVDRVDGPIHKAVSGIGHVSIG